MLLSFPSKERLIEGVGQGQLPDVGVVISNHRKLAGWNVIPVSKLTVLLGPNSAGKSSVSEALNCLSLFTFRQSTWAPAYEIMREASRGENQEPAYGACFSYPIEEKAQQNFMEVWTPGPSAQQNLGVGPALMKLNHFWGFIRGEKRFQNLNFVIIFENITASSLIVSVYFDGDLVARWSTDSMVQTVEIMPKAVEFVLGFDSPVSLGRKDSYPGFKLTFDYNDWSIYAPEKGPSWPSATEFPSYLFGMRPALDPSSSGLSTEQVFTLIAVLFSFPVSSRLENVCRVFESDPLRDLNSEWFFLRAENERGKKSPSYQFRKDSERVALGRSGKERIAREAAVASITQLSRPELAESPLLSKINEWLGSKNFFDSGYQLRVDLRICVPLEHIKKGFDIQKSFDLAYEHEELDASKFRGLVKDDATDIMARIILLDARGRELSFAEVGTGFSQIIPILIYLGVFRNYFIRQPEVHLHPKLQSRFADCVVSEASKHQDDDVFVGTIIETHSEHIVLRLQRRARETFRGVGDSSLRLKAKDLSLVYFKPDNDQTEVHLIRLLSTGEFIDVWPDGFFDERDEDLWGEV